MVVSLAVFLIAGLAFVPAGELPMTVFRKAKPSIESILGIWAFLISINRKQLALQTVMVLPSELIFVLQKKHCKRR